MIVSVGGLEKWDYLSPGFWKYFFHKEFLIQVLHEPLATSTDNAIRAITPGFPDAMTNNNRVSLIGCTVYQSGIRTATPRLRQFGAHALPDRGLSQTGAAGSRLCLRCTPLTSPFFFFF